MSEDIERRMRAVEAALTNLRSAGRPLDGAGTAFPSGPATGARFWRTDLGLYCYYDGTRWLTVNEYEAPIPTFDAQPYGASTSPAGYLSAPAVYSRLLTRYVVSAAVLTTNNASNYWQFDLINATTGATISTLSSSSLTANVWGTVSGTPSAVSTTPLQIDIVKVNAPGSLFTAAAVYYRLIVT